MERFRPNVVIDGVEAYDEDRIHELRAGPVTLRIVKPCTRCSITTTDQQQGAVDGVEPLRTLKEYRFDPQLRGVAFGQNAIVVDGVGEQLRVGQTLRHHLEVDAGQTPIVASKSGSDPINAGVARRSPREFHGARD